MQRVESTNRQIILKGVATLQSIRLLLASTCVALLIGGAHTFDYCALKCDEGVHTMCLYPTEDLGPLCVDYDKALSVLTQEDKDAILDSHNKYRSDVAMGKETQGSPGPQPPAANMMELVWDEEMETMAKRYALQCIYEHDKCRTLRDGNFAGQNIGIKAGSASGKTSHVEGFYKEVKFFDSSFVDNLQMVGGPPVGHYTQLVWATTSKLGCAVSRFAYAKFVKEIYGLSEMLVCDYGPGGNVVGAPIYIKGDGCSQCPQGTVCSNRYPGLCTVPGSSPTTGAPPQETSDTGPASESNSPAPSLPPPAVVEKTSDATTTTTTTTTTPTPPSPANETETTGTGVAATDASSTSSEAASDTTSATTTATATGTGTTPVTTPGETDGTEGGVWTTVRTTTIQSEKQNPTQNTDSMDRNLENDSGSNRVLPRGTETFVLLIHILLMIFGR